MPCPTITVQTSTGGPREVPTKWAGQWLAVHRPVRRDGLSTAPALWTLTLRPLGLSGGELAAPLPAVVAFARLWDTPAARWDDVAEAADATAWRWRDRFRDDVDRVRRGRPPIGPRALTPTEAIESAGTAAEVAAAVAAAMGAPAPMTEAEAAEQWPAELTRKTDGAGAIARRDGELALYWLPSAEGGTDLMAAMELAGWYPIPAAGDVERWCLGSTAETPAGDHVEPDHPDAWPRLLGLI